MFKKIAHSTVYVALFTAAFAFAEEVIEPVPVPAASQLKTERIVHDGIDDECASLRTSGIEDGKWVSRWTFEDIDKCERTVKRKKNYLSALYLGEQYWEWQNYRLAVTIWESTPTKSCLTAFHLGVAYSNGKGVVKNFKTAARFYRLASFNGCRIQGAQNNLGLMHEDGEGVAQDFVQAYALYLLATSEYEHGIARNNLNRIEKRMTVKQQEQGQELAAKWAKQQSK